MSWGQILAALGVALLALGCVWLMAFVRLSRSIDGGE